MFIFKIMRIILLSLYWQMPRAKDAILPQQSRIERDLSQKKVKKQIRQKRQKQRLPAIIRKSGFNQSNKRGRPKDTRYTNQRSLRRMYRNS